MAAERPKQTKSLVNASLLMPGAGEAKQRVQPITLLTEAVTLGVGIGLSK